MAQVLRIKSAGGLVKKSLSPRIKRSDGYQTRQEKKRITSRAQKYINDKVQHSNLEFLLAANIKAGDWFLTLTYDDAHLPSNWEQANRNMQTFCRKLREHRHPEKTVYFYNIERVHYSEDPNCSHRFHHHMIVSSGQTAKELQAMWPRGFLHAKRIKFNRDFTYDSLATYMIKERNEFPGKRAWRASQHLEKPKVITIIVPDDFEIKPPVGNVSILENTGVVRTEYGRFQAIKYFEHLTDMKMQC